LHIWLNSRPLDSDWIGCCINKQHFERGKNALICQSFIGGLQRERRSPETLLLN
jgi:hypothetical protein